MPHIGWEYCTVYIPDAETRDLAPLNNAGAAGWEFTGHTYDTGYGIEYLMKKQRQMPV